MTIAQLPFAEIPQLSKLDQAYAASDPALRPFYQYEPRLEAFAEAISAKKAQPIDRETLVEVLEEQYRKLETSPATAANIAALRQPNTHTIVTAHQPSLFTGPLYYLYKIISAINLAQSLQQAYPACRFVPVFITGGEDHDFEEVNHLHLFGKRIEWESGERGPVGMMGTATLRPVLEEVRAVLGESENAQALIDILQAAVEQHDSYSGTARHLANALFKADGLVVLDTNHRALKALFRPIIREEILEQPSKPLVQQAHDELEKAGFSGQAHPREINFFYLQPGLRERIVEEGGRFQVLNTSLSFSREELVAEIEQHPERFSPNVVMRPVYQEFILPNLAYIGGGGELAYWLERKAQFAHFGVCFPVLVRRNSALIIDSGSAKRMEKLGLSSADIFRDVELLIKDYVRNNTEKEISLAQEKAQLEGIFKQIEQKAREVDPTLVKAFAAEKARQMNSLQQLEGKLMRAEKQRHDTAINQLRALKDKLFPGGGLQERHDNFMMYYLKHGPAFLEALKAHLHPLRAEFTVMVEE
jgi:bacillithiol synthase